MELAGQLRSSDASVTIIRPGCRLLKEDDVQVANLSGNGDLHQKIVLLVSIVSVVQDCSGSYRKLHLVLCFST